MISYAQNVKMLLTGSDKMPVYEVWHRIVKEYFLGEIEAKESQEVKDMASELIPLIKDDYETDEEIIIQKIGD